MLKNYLKIALRNLLRHKGYSLINITGLAVGIACCLLILLYVQDELAYDRHHEKAEQIYRVVLDGRLADKDFHFAVASAPLAVMLPKELPEVLASTRLQNRAGILVRHGEKRFTEDRIFYADSTMFGVFTMPLLLGNSQTALAQPNTIVLTAAMAAKYFGDENPIGKTLALDNQNYQITGMMQDVPRQSHFHPDFLAAMATLSDSRDQSWLSNNFYTYLVLPANSDPKAFETKLAAVVKKYVDPQIKAAIGVGFDEFIASGGRYRYVLQRLTDIHLHSKLDVEIEPNGDIKYLYIFSAIAVFILLIACINFMNLATARSANRAKEVGVRKVLGSLRTQLVQQFLSESMLISFIALLIAIGLVELLLPFFNNLAARHLQADFFSDNLARFGLIGFALLVGIIAGSYPAFFLASFQPVSVLKGKLSRRGGRSHWLRSGLVVSQFAISIALIVGTAVVHQQLQYVQSQNLGFNKAHVVVIQKASELGQQGQAFKQELLRYPNVLNASTSTEVPGRWFSNTAVQPEGAPPDRLELVWYLAADDDFVKTLDMKITAGRNFSKAFSMDSSAVIINETAVKRLGWTDAVGKKIVLRGRTPEESLKFTVIGVLKDFHFESLRQEIRPFALFPQSALRERTPSFVAVRIRPQNLPATLAFLEDKWQEFVPHHPFEYSFLDADFEALYRAEQRTGKIFGAFSALAILIACLGLFGLASFMAVQRTKEIGVRKVLGASISQVVILLSKDFTQLVLIAIAIAAPVAYFAMNRWLQNFAYRIDIGWWVFALAGGLALLIAFITVSTQALKAALANPVEALRYE
jgi:putative ABC transport system permease protein